MANAHLILKNGNVLTMAAAQPRADAIAVADGRIVAVGSNADIRALASPDAAHVDLYEKGRGGEKCLAVDTLTVPLRDNDCSSGGGSCCSGPPRS